MEYKPIAASSWWGYCLIAIGSASSMIHPHAPLVGFATLAGVTLSRRQAVVSVLLIWFVNQFLGFTVRQYPLSPIALMWGLSMGFAAVAVALIAAIGQKFTQDSLIKQGAWTGIALVLGFLLYQSSSLLVSQWVEMHGLTVDVLLRIFYRDLVWAIGLFSLHTVFFNQQRLRQTQR
jgi:hypothetical protein